MNAAAYLSKQGWRGEGFSLDQSNRGLSRPLLVAHKTNLGGIGKKEQQDFNDQWWLAAWGKNDKSVNAAPPVISSKNPLSRYKPLYGNFVQGQTLESTIKERVCEPAEMAPTIEQALANNSDFVPLDDSNVQQNSSKKKTKRKHDSGGDESKKRKKNKLSSSATEATSAETQAAAELIDSSQHNQTEPSKKRGKEKEEKKLRQQIKAERKTAKGTTGVENARKKREEEAEILAAIHQANNFEPHPSDDESDTDSDDEQPEGPVAAESISGLRDAGQQVLMPLLPDLPRDSRDPWYRAYELSRIEAKKAGRCTLTLPQMDKWVATNGLPDTPSAQANKSYKADKYERERLRRWARREYKHWQVVFTHPWRYRPDGLPVDGSEVDIEHGKKNKKKKAKAERKPNLQGRATPEEKKARRAAKDERRAKMRAFKKEARAERKLRNLANTVALRKEAEERKTQRQREKDQEEAAKQGVGYEDYVKNKLEAEVQKLQSRAAKKRAAAEAKRAIEIQRRKNMQSDTASLEAVEQDKRASNAAIDKIALANQSSGSARRNSDYISLDAGASEDELQESTTASRKPVSPSRPSAIAASDPEMTSAGLGFVIDTVGDTSLGANGTSARLSASRANTNGTSVSSSAVEVPENIKVKEMTKEQRKARLEQMKTRRQERRAAEGKNGLSKKDKQQSRAERKEAMLHKLAAEILRKKRMLPANAQDPAVQGMSRKDKRAVPSAGKGWTRDDWKSAQREARRFQRAVKAGKVPEDEVPLGWTGTIRKEPKRKGNGGRDPEKPFWHEWSMGGERLDLR